MSKGEIEKFSIRVTSVSFSSPSGDHLEIAEQETIPPENQLVCQRSFRHKLALYYPDCPLADVQYADSMFPYFSLGVLTIFVTLLSVVLWNSKREQSCDANERQWYLERAVPQTAFWILLVSLASQGVTLYYRSTHKPSGILFAGMTVLLVSATTNALLAWGPTMVVFDKVTQSRVYLFRWCEWVPMALLMTLLAESTDLPKKPMPFAGATVFAVSQSLSTLCGLIFPFCINFYTWSIVMILSFVCFLPIFPRVMVRRETFLKTPRGRTVLEREHYDRRRISYHLVLTCSVVWSG